MVVAICQRPGADPWLGVGLGVGLRELVALEVELELKAVGGVLHLDQARVLERRRPVGGDTSRNVSLGVAWPDANASLAREAAWRQRFEQ